MIPTVLGAGVPDTVNVVLNFITVALIVGGAILTAILLPKYVGARDSQAQLAAKDEIIETDRQARESLLARVDGLTEEVRECQEAAKVAQLEARQWQARYEEQAKYTAEPALTEVRIVMGELKEALTTAVTAHGDLVLEEMRQTRVVLDRLAARASSG